MSGYVKLYSTIITSSIWLESHATLRVWITMLTLADRHGEVSGSIGGLAHVANVSREECAAALEIFMAPDPDSRTPDHEGRRIERTESGWLVLNAEKYRDMRTETQVEWAEKKRKWREERSKADLSIVSDMSSDMSETSETRQIASSSTTASSSNAVKDVVVDARELSNLLITRLNQGMLDNPAIGQALNPIPHGHAPSLAAAEEIAEAEVPTEFASDAVYAGAKKYKPTGRNRQISSLAYLAAGVISQWEKSQAREAANGTSRPAGKSLNGKHNAGEQGYQNALIALRGTKP